MKALKSIFIENGSKKLLKISHNRCLADLKYGSEVIKILFICFKNAKSPGRVLSREGDRLKIDLFIFFLWSSNTYYITFLASNVIFSTKFIILIIFKKNVGE